MSYLLTLFKIIQNEEIIELQDIRNSPIACLRNRRTGGLSVGASVSESELRFPPSFRMANPAHRTVFANNRSNRLARGSGQKAGGHPRVLQTLKRGASALKVHMPKMGIKDVNKIDMCSRVIFPVSFMIFNASYWGFYIYM